MATAKRISVDTVRVIPARQEVTSTPAVELVLSPEEAQFLTDVLSKIGGCPSGRRGLQLTISAALSKLGYAFSCDHTLGTSNPDAFKVPDFTGAITVHTTAAEASRIRRLNPYRG